MTSPTGGRQPVDVARERGADASRFRGAYAWAKPRRRLFFLDIAAAAAATIFAWGWLWGGDYRHHVIKGSLSAHDIMLAAIGIAVIVIMTRDGEYEGRRRLSRVDDALELVKALTLAFAIGMGLAFLTKGFGTGFTNYSRLVLVLYLVGLLLFMGAARWAMWAWQQRLFRRGEGVRRLLVAGAGASAAEFDRFLGERHWLGYGVAGHIAVLEHATESDRIGGLPLQAPLLGGIAELPAALYTTGAGEVVIALDRDEQPRFPQLVAALHALAAPFRVVPSQFEQNYRHVQAIGLDSLATVSLPMEPAEHAQRALKRVADVLGAGAALVLLSPLLLLVALLVALTSRGGVFYHQTRVGLDGGRFRMYKFRTMYKDADARLAELTCYNEVDGAAGCMFKIKDDPRITPIGRFLRRWSIDELPQFWNALKGDMSIVGPRPPLPCEVDAYETGHLGRLKGKPGITGLWQVSGRSDLPFEKMVDLDTYYLEHWSLSLDMSILLRTALVVVRRQGAY